MERSALKQNVALATMFVWIGTSACHKWVPLETSPPLAEQVDSGDRLRVTTADGQEIGLFHDVRLGADTLSGFTARGHSDAPSRRVAIALRDIERIEARKAKVGSTIALVAGGGLLIAAIIAAATFDLGNLGLGEY